MSFYDSASLAFLPSGGAGKDGKAYSIKPVPEYGNELITNGGFDTDSSWTKGTGWTISGGTANFTGSAYGDGISNFNVTTLNKVYAFSCDIISGSFDVKVGSTSYFPYSSGTIYVTANNTSSNAVIIRPLSSSVVIDNVSVKEVIVDGDFDFSRGSNLTATRVDSNGLIEKGRENLLLQSNQFDTTWSLLNSQVTSGQSGYDGSSDAWLLERSGSGANVFIRSTTISASGICTISIYAKASNSNWLVIQDSSFGLCYFDLSNGTFGFASASIIDKQITSVGNGWYRCSITTNRSSGLVQFYVATANLNLSGPSDAALYIQDSQAEIGLTSTEYIESGASTGLGGILEDSPRFDYSGGASCPSLLLEPSRTNLIGQSEYLVSINAGSVEYNSSISPEGLQNATKVIFGASVNDGATMNLSASCSGNTQYTWSAYVKNISGTGLFNIRIDTDTTTILVNQDIAATSEWTRVSHTFTTDASATSFGSNSRYRSDADGNEILIWGAQLEEGSYPTSYIPNHSGGSVTRNVDGSLSNTNFSDIFGSSSLTQYSIFLDIKDGDDTGLTRVLITKGTNTQGRINLLNGNSICYYSVATGYTTGNNYTDGSPHKYLLVADNGTIKQYFDGSLISTDTNTSDEFTAFGIGGLKSMRISQYLLFPTALSDTDCEILTGTSYESFAAMATALNYTTYE